MSQRAASDTAATSADSARPPGRVPPLEGAGDPWPPDDQPPDALDDWPPDGLTEELDDWLDTESPRVPEALPAGLLPRDCGDGPGFAAGGVADRLAPDVALAGFARDAWTDGLGRLTDDELIGVLRAWRRLNSWTAAGELAAVTELADRRIAQAAAGADSHLIEHVGDELAASLTLTARGADALLDFACGLARLPLTRAALKAGEIDRAKAFVIVDEVSCLDDAHAAAVESAVIGRAPGQTTGRLRAATKRAAQAVDSAAARERRERAQRNARVEVWDEHSGTAALAGRDLPPADVLAADKRIDALAKQLKAAGKDGTLDQLRAGVYTALLLGYPVESLEPRPGESRPGEPQPGERRGSEPQPAESGVGESQSAEPQSDECPRSESQPGELSRDKSRPGKSTASEPQPGESAAGESQPESAAGEPWSGIWRSGEAQSGQPGETARRIGPGLTGCVNLTLPLTTWLGVAEEPGDAAGFGPIPADDARALVDLISSQPAARWCLTLTDRDGRAVGHGCARAGPDRRRSSRREAGQDDDWALTVTVRPLAVSDCGHQRETAGYRPSPSLQHVINARHGTCGFPGCRRPAAQCDQDHTVPYDRGGRTCECNLACLCRRHHRAKQAQGWRLDQPEPGVLVWTLPHGRSYRMEPSGYPAAGQ